MRLTLRALLAYLYNVLEPADADEFAGKVQESAVASGLVQRIGGITRKMRMSAPRTDAKGTAADANNVAEYLDNSLPDEQVGDFERACINSDMHLAEVASSYQVLTMVLGKPAEIPQHLRQRIYALPLEIAIAHKAHGDGDGAERQRLKKTIEKVAKTSKEADAAAKAVRTGSTHPVPEVPEYLRRPQSSSTLMWGLAVAAIVLIVGLIGVRAAGPFDASNVLIGWMFKPPAKIADASGKSTAAEQKITSGDEVPSAAGNDKEPSAASANDKASPSTASAEDKTTDSEKTSAKPDANEKSTSSAATSKASSKPDEGTPLPPPPPPPDEPDTATSEKGSDAKGTAKSEKGTDATATRPPAPVDPMDVGRYVSDLQVLTRFDARAGVWLRLPPRQILAAGERLVVPPTFRPQIALGSGVQVTFAGDSAVQMEEPLHPGSSRMTVEYGRFLMLNSGKEGAQLELNLQGLAGTLTLEGADTVVAVEVRHFLPPGSSAEMDARVLVIELFATSGSARWEEEGQDPIDIPAHHVLTYVAGSERELSGPFQSPDWIDISSVSDIDRLTSLELQKSLDPSRPVHVTLAELMGDRRVDVRALAARSLASLGEFEPLIKELNNPQQKSFWAPEVDVLRQSLSRGPEVADQIRQSLERLRPQDATALYRLLWGYSPEQLAGDGAKELVGLLESPAMDVRVLASDTLRQITGAQLLYRPEKAPAENRPSINRWQERLADGSIVYKTPPSPVPERKPLAAPEVKPAKGKEGK